MCHERVDRRTGHWLSEGAAQKRGGYLGGATILHAHRRDAAQQGFYDACKVAASQRKMGLEMRYRPRRHVFRTTTWKHTGVRIREGVRLLSRARGLEPIRVALPEHLRAYRTGPESPVASARG